MKYLNLLFLILLITACNKDQAVEQSTKLAGEPDDILTLDINDESTLYEAWYGYSETIKDPFYGLYIRKNRVQINQLEQTLNQFDLSMERITQKNHSLIGSVLYLNFLPEDHSSIQEENILGVIIYYRNAKDRLTAAFLQRNGSSFEAVEELNREIDFITMNDIYSLNHLFAQPGQKIAAIFSVNSAEIPTHIRGTRYSQAIANYTKGKSKNGEKAGNNCETACPSPCEGNGNTCVVGTDSHGDPVEQCGCASCGGDKAQALIENSGRSYSLQHDKLYDFRDDFLSKSSKGETYIDYYYEISKTLVEKLELSLALEGVGLANAELLPLLDKLIKNENSKEVLYGNGTKNALIDYLKKVKDLSKNRAYGEMIDQVIKDIDHYANKTIGEILKDFS